MKLKLLFLSFFITTALYAESQRHIGQQAPSFGELQWLQTYKKDLNIDDLKGKVVYIATFQDSCPYCHRVGLPALKELYELYKDEKDMQFIGIQTAFEDDEENDISSLKSIIKEYDLKMPVANSKRGENNRPQFMNNYQTAGTPWVIIIAKDGTVQFSDFQLHLDLAMVMLRQFQKE